MYAYVNNSTGEVHLFDSFEAAGDHGREQGLTAFHIRPVVPHLDTTRERVERVARQAAAPTSMDAFLAGGQ